MTDQIVTKFRWTVKSFDMCQHSKGQSLESPEFCVGTYKFRGRLYPRGCDNAEYISVFIVRLNDSGESAVYIDYEVCLIDDKGLRKNVSRSNSKFCKNRSWGSKHFIEQIYLFTMKRNELLPNNSLTIEYTILSLSEKEINDNSKFYHRQESELLSKNLAELLNSGIHSDIKIHVGGIKIKVHKAIIKCRCPNLLARLKETNILNEFSLPGFEPSVLQILLQYLYSGIFSDCNFYKKILIASDTFSLTDLRNDLVFSYRRSIFASTEIMFSRSSFKWTVTDFSKLRLDQALVYPVFCNVAQENQEINFFLSISRRKSEPEKLELKFQNMAADTVIFVRCKISLFEENHLAVPVCIKEYENMFKDEWITPLFPEKKISEIIFMDTLNMFFEISLSNGKQTSNIDEISFESKTHKAGVDMVRNLKLLQGDILNLYRDRSFSDIILCVNGIKLPAHKAIMCARSPVFAKMFEHDTLEKQECIVNIDDMEAATVSSMLRYIYSGCIDELSISETINMYAAADKYELLTLKNKCATLLKLSISVDYVGDILLLADSHHDESLKKSVCDYIVANPKKVRRSQRILSTLINRTDVYTFILNVVLKHISTLKGESSSDSDGY